MNFPVFSSQSGYRVIPCRQEPLEPQDEPQDLFPGESALITVARFSEITGLCARVIRTEIQVGRLPGCKIGSRYFIPKGALSEFVLEGGGIHESKQEKSR